MTTQLDDRRASVRAEFAALLPQLATALGATNGDNGFPAGSLGSETERVLTFPDGMRLWVSLHSHGHPAAAKVSIALCSLHYTDATGKHQSTHAYEVTRHGELAGATREIGASLSRGAAAIARDVARRLLPDARRIWAAMVARRESALGYAAKTQTTLALIAAAAGREARGNGDTGTVYLEHGTCRVSGDSVTFERLSVDVAKALRLIAIINE